MHKYSEKRLCIKGKKEEDILEFYITIEDQLAFGHNCVEKHYTFFSSYLLWAWADVFDMITCTK